ncbi:MAG: hypothetical protein KC621_33715, partial [Myxococcales bacterium]|nr:hypothetical protein [Myxococcales bacterium]
MRFYHVVDGVAERVGTSGDAVAGQMTQSLRPLGEGASRNGPSEPFTTWHVPCTTASGAKGDEMRWIGWVSLLFACGGHAEEAGVLGSSGVWITYELDGVPYVLDVEDGVTASLSALLDDIEERPKGVRRPETGVNVAPDSSAFAVLTERFHGDCAGWPCLAVVTADATEADVVAPPSGVAHPMDFAVGPDGDRVVYSDDDRVLWTSVRSDGAWSEPEALSAASTYAYAWRPALSADGSSVLFDCGDELFPAEAICEVGTDGTGFRVVVTNDAGPQGSSGPGVHHPDYAPDGSIVFEAEYDGGEQ